MGLPSPYVEALQEAFTSLQGDATPGTSTDPLLLGVLAGVEGESGAVALPGER